MIVFLVIYKVEVVKFIVLVDVQFYIIDFIK